MANKGWERDLYNIGRRDAETLIRKNEEYGNSWANRGGQGAFFVTARKWDRIENQVKKLSYDIFKALKEDTREDGLIDDVRDLRSYLMLIEAEMMSWGIEYDAQEKTLVRGRTEHPAPFGFDAKEDCQQEYPRCAVCGLVGKEVIYCQFAGCPSRVKEAAE